MVKSWLSEKRNNTMVHKKRSSHCCCFFNVYAEHTKYTNNCMRFNAISKSMRFSISKSIFCCSIRLFPSSYTEYHFFPWNSISFERFFNICSSWNPLKSSHDQSGNFYWLFHENWKGKNIIIVKLFAECEGNIACHFRFHSIQSTNALDRYKPNSFLKIHFQFSLYKIYLRGWVSVNHFNWF